MKIISDFIDYYDFQQSKNSPINTPIIYNRFSVPCSSISDLKSKNSFPNLNTIKKISNDNWEVLFFAIGFCGTLYKGVRFKNNGKCKTSYTLTGSLCIPKEMGIPLLDEIKSCAIYHFKDNYLNISHDVFEEINAPYFMVRPSMYKDLTIIKNPKLSNYHFIKNINPYDAFNLIKNFT